MQAKDEATCFVHHDIGYNYRLNNISAAIAVAQLENLDERVQSKKKIYVEYEKELNVLDGLEMIKNPEYSDSNYWMAAVQIEKDAYGLNKEEVMKQLLENKVEVRSLWYLNHLQKPYQTCQNYKIDKALKMYEETLTIPCSVCMESDDQKIVVDYFRAWQKQLTGAVHDA